MGIIAVTDIVNTIISLLDNGSLVQMTRISHDFMVLASVAISQRKMFAYSNIWLYRIYYSHKTIHIIVPDNWPYIYKFKRIQHNPRWITYRDQYGLIANAFDDTITNTQFTFVYRLISHGNNNIKIEMGRVDCLAPIKFTINYY